MTLPTNEENVNASGQRDLRREAALEKINREEIAKFVSTFVRLKKNASAGDTEEFISSAKRVSNWKRHCPVEWATAEAKLNNLPTVLSKPFKQALSALEKQSREDRKLFDKIPKKTPTVQIGEPNKEHVAMPGINALSYGSNTTGNDDLFYMADGPDPDGLATLLHLMNRDHAIVPLEDGTVRVLHQTMGHDDKPESRMLKPEDFHRLYSHVRVHKNAGMDLSISQVWERWPDRRGYLGVRFAPGSDRNPPRINKDYLNTWTGPRLKPIKGNWALFQPPPAACRMPR